MYIISICPLNIYKLAESIADTPWATIDAIVRKQDETKIKRIHKTIDALLIFVRLNFFRCVLRVIQVCNTGRPVFSGVNGSVGRFVQESTARVARGFHPPSSISYRADR